MLDIKLTGSEQAIKDIAKIFEQTNASLEDIIVKGAFDIEKDAKQAVPVDTGRLRSSITYEMITKSEARIGTNVEYAPWIEFETGRRLAPVGATWSRRHGKGNARVLWVSGKARPYLYPALTKNQARINRNIENYIKSLEK